MAGGSIRGKSGDRWELRVSYPRQQDQPRRQLSKTIVGTRAEAEAILAVWIAELGLDRIEPVLSQAFEQWYTATRNRRTTRSNEAVRHNIDAHLTPNIGGWRITEITAGRLERWYSQYQESLNLSDGTVRHLHFVVRPSMRLAVRWGWIDANPADLVDLGPLRRREISLPALADIRALMAAIDASGDDELSLFVRLAAITGARRSEVAGLRWCDVDWLTTSIQVRGAVSEPAHGPLEYKAPKTARSRRTVPLDPDTLSRLARRREVFARFNADEDSWFIFGTGPIPPSPAALTGRFLRQRDRLGYRFRLHDLRHFAASAWLASGMRVMDVSQLLGHARTSTTWDIYGKLMDRPSSLGADLIAGMLDDAQPPRQSETERGG